jgi:hypothetical protein
LPRGLFVLEVFSAGLLAPKEKFVGFFVLEVAVDGLLAPNEKFVGFFVLNFRVTGEGVGAGIFLILRGVTVGVALLLASVAVGWKANIEITNVAMIAAIIVKFVFFILFSPFF